MRLRGWLGFDGIECTNGERFLLARRHLHVYWMPKATLDGWHVWPIATSVTIGKLQVQWLW
ncbi:MAG: hypothetical protein Q7J25_12240 [Vicinamibacterales bacterium]|nr:hypothetical protein [Vicinamibacterales bacterium]